MNAEALIRNFSEREQRWLPRPAVAAIVFVNFALVIATIAAFAHFGSVQTALGYWLEGETLFVDAKEKSLGVVAPERDRHCLVQVNEWCSKQHPHPRLCLGLYVYRSKGFAFCPQGEREQGIHRHGSRADRTTNQEP